MKIDDLDNGLGNIITGAGRITGEEFCTTLDKHFSQPIEKFNKYIYSIVDVTEATYVTVSLEDIRLIAEKSLEIAKQNPDITVAIATNGEVSSILAEIWELLVDESSWNVSVFDNMSELEQWLKPLLLKKYRKYQLSYC